MIRALYRGLTRRDQVEQDMADELQFHVEARADDLAARWGLARQEALRQARIEFGSMERYKAEGRQARGLQLFDDLRADLTFAFRRLRKNPGFTVAVVLFLGLVIGGNLAIFSIMNAVLLRPLPFVKAHRLAMVIGNVQRTGTEWRGASLPDYRDW